MASRYYLIHGMDPFRKGFMESEFSKNGLRQDEVTWIYYPNKNDDFPPNICINPILKKGQIACTYKHYLALKDIVENKHEIAVIMEDNIQFKGHIPDAINRYLKEVPSGWDIIWDSNFVVDHDFCSDSLFFDGEKRSIYSEKMTTVHPNGFHTFNYDTQTYFDFKATNKILYKKDESRGANFYIVNKRSAKLLYDNFLPFSNCSDHHYNDLIKRHNLNSYWVEPPNVDKLQRYSTWKDNSLAKYIWNRNLNSKWIIKT